MRGISLKKPPLRAVFSLLFLSRFYSRNNHAGKREKCECVGQNHQIVEGIREFPNEVGAEHSTEENEANRKNGINDRGNLLLFACQREHVLLTEEVPADDGGESKEGKAILNRNNVKLIRLQAEKLNDPELKALLDKFNIQGLPALILLKSK